MTLPAGWIANTPAPERALPEYTGDPTPHWRGNPTGWMAQPASVPVMAITAAIAQMLAGAQQS